MTDSINIIRKDGLARECIPSIRDYVWSPEFHTFPILGVPEDEIVRLWQKGGSLKPSTSKPQRCNDICVSKDFIHDCPHTVNILIAYLDEDRTRISK